MSVLIGLNSLYYAILTSDPVGGTPTYDAPVRIAGAIKAGVNPNASLETLFADDGPSETASTIGQISVELNVSDLDLDTQAVLLGHTKSGGILIRKGGDVPPWVALGFKTLKSNGKYRYTWLAKGKFAIPEQNNETKGDTVTFQTPTIQGSFVKRDSDDEWERHIDEDDTDYLPALGTAWFTSPIGSNDTTPPTLSSVVPADAAAGVAVGSTVVWTFNEALALSTINSNNFMVMEEVSGTKVPGALTVNAGRTIVTFTPTGNMDAATLHIAIVGSGVKDLSGNAYAGSVSTFTTA
jgi:phi13 family phage major tail protein